MYMSVSVGGGVVNKVPEYLHEGLTNRINAMPCMVHSHVRMIAIVLDVEEHTNIIL